MTRSDVTKFLNVGVAATPLVGPAYTTFADCDTTLATSRVRVLFDILEVRPDETTLLTILGSSRIV